MNLMLKFINSPIGSKFIMALSGGFIGLFLMGHVLGNLLIFDSPAAINTYAGWLQANPLLWVFRVAMLVLFSIHIYYAIRLYIQNKAARPIRYAVENNLQLGLSEKTMLISGLIILIFLLFHIAHLSLDWLPFAPANHLDGRGMPDVYTNIWLSFNNPFISGFYLISMLLLGLHLFHALKSMFQTLGFHHENFHHILSWLAPVIIIILIASFMTIPLAVITGILDAADTVIEQQGATRL